MSFEGTWDLTIATPIGRMNSVVELSRRDGVLSGHAKGAAEQVALQDIVVDGDHLTWRQSVTKPMRLNLAFAVRVEGDTLTGTSKAGRLPASKVTGRRRADDATHADAAHADAACADTACADTARADTEER
jgi:hypothetical protein